MNLFPFQKAAEPIMPKNMSIDAYMKGVETGAQDPSVMTAVARGISAGIDSYNKQVINQQKIQINDQVIQSQQITLDQARELQQLSQEEQKAALEAKKIEHAKAVRLNQQMTRVSEILQSNDPTSALSVLTSGEYAELLSSNPNLERQIAKLSFPAMSVEQATAFGVIKDDAVAKRNILAKKQQYTAEAQTLAPEVENIVSTLSFPDEEKTVSRLDKATIKDARMLQTDPKTGMVTGTIPVPEGGATPSTFAVYDHDTGEVFGYIDKAQKESIDKYRQSVRSLESIGDFSQSYSSPVQAGFRDAKRDQEIQKREAAPIEQRREVARTRSLARQAEVKIRTGQPISQEDYTQYLSAQPILTTKGQVDLTTAPQVITAGLSAQGVPASISSKYADKLAGPISDLANVRSGTAAPKNKAVSMAELALTTRNMLIDEYNTLGDTLGVKYTDEDVAAHNKRVEEYQAATSAGRTTGYNRDYMMQGSTPSIIPPTPARRVESPADLYAGKNEYKLNQKIISLADQINGSVISRRVKAARRSTLTTDIQSILGK